MSSIVIELQREALDRGVRLSDLLRKGMVVARKLGITELETWISRELGGYQDDVPTYRVVQGQIKAFNPFRGWQPVVFENPREAEILSKRQCGDSVAELEHLLENARSHDFLAMSFPKEVEQRLMGGLTIGGTGMHVGAQPVLQVHHSAIAGILDTVRTIVLNWALKLESDGILGEGLSFTVQEKAAAADATYNINNFFAPVGTSQIQQSADRPIQIAAGANIDASQVARFLTELREVVEGLGLDQETNQELSSETSTIEAQLRSPRPKSAIVRESLLSIRRILEGAAGGAGGRLVVDLLPRLIALLS